MTYQRNFGYSYWPGSLDESKRGRRNISAYPEIEDFGDAGVYQLWLMSLVEAVSIGHTGVSYLVPGERVPMKDVREFQRWLKTDEPALECRFLGIELKSLIRAIEERHLVRIEGKQRGKSRRV